MREHEGYRTPARRAASRANSAIGAAKAKKRTNQSQGVLIRFWSKVTVADSGCWEWTASKKGGGYGQFGYMGRPRAAHRVAWLLTFGDPGAMSVLHACDNPPCVNPDHLFLGDPRANTFDMWSKDRGSKGSGHANAKLDESQVVEIRRLVRETSMTFRQIGERFGVCAQSAWDAAKGDTWKWLEDGR